tara:strand:+ start:167 stop:1483 length:1317 start_codon:yes stop_codon:yes gene_type:complete
MNKIINSEEIKKILDHLDKQEFNFALERIQNLSVKFPNDLTLNKLFASTYFKKSDWHNTIKYNKKILVNGKDKYLTYINIGIAYFKLGEIHKSIEAYKKSIEDNSNFEITYNNLAISYIEIGLYEEAFINFIKTLKVNKKNKFANKNLIYLLNFINPKNVEDHDFIEINCEIKKLVNQLEVNNINKIDFLKETINQSDNIIKKYYKNLFFEETQIYRKNSQNLNCNRHFKVFKKFNIIPKFCFSCYKVQINLKSVIDLIKLYFVFDKINLENNNTRKCAIELRDKVKGNYKGYIYCSELIEAMKIKEELNKILINEKLNNFKIEIKHGCTEYYNSYPKFKKINFEGEQEFNYNEHWYKQENIIDKLEPIRSEENKKILIQSSKGINLSDILIIKNWINYAYIIGDHSYKKIYTNHIDASFLSNILQNQINFRVKELKD